LQNAVNISYNITCTCLYSTTIRSHWNCEICVKSQIT